MKWFYDLRISKKLLISFVLILSLTSALGSLCHLPAGQSQSGFHRYRHQLAAQHPHLAGNENRVVADPFAATATCIDQR